LRISQGPRVAIVGYAAPLSVSAGAVAVRAELLTIDGADCGGGEPQASHQPKRIEKMNAAIDPQIADYLARW